MWSNHIKARRPPHTLHSCRACTAFTHYPRSKPVFGIHHVTLEKVASKREKCITLLSQSTSNASPAWVVTNLYIPQESVAIYRSVLGVKFRVGGRGNVALAFSHATTNANNVNCLCGWLKLFEMEQKSWVYLPLFANLSVCLMWHGWCVCVRGAQEWVNRGACFGTCRKVNMQCMSAA